MTNLLYLQKLKKGVDEIATKKNIIIAICVLCIIGAIYWTVCQHYDNETKRENSNVTDTIQSIEDDNQRAREHLGTAAEQIRQAGQQLDSAAASIDAGQRTINDNKAVINDSRQLIESSKRNLEQAESVIRTIDEANQ